ncbi:MAG: lysophospholipid acyltransferase family protein [Treponema sp.]|nr:lysophospholipid acyltransferase family protein [Treponema sp.]
MRTFIALIRIAIFMLSKNKLRKLALKYDREGNIAERDKIVDGIVPVWARFVFEVVGATVEVHGEENIPKDRACVFIGNHQGDMDIPLLYGYSNKQMAFVAKVELSKIPVLRDWMRLLQCTFIDRKSPKKSIQAIHDAASGVQKGYSQVIFPEGHRSKGFAHREFKAGSFKLAFLSNSPIVPVTIDGTWRIFEEKGRLVPGQHVSLTFHKPIETAGLTREEQAKIPSQVESIVCAHLPSPREPKKIEKK